MKILFVAPGAALHATRWIDRAKEIDFEVVLFSQDGVTPLGDYKTITVNNLGMKQRNNPFLQLLEDIKALKIAIKSERPDFVHIHWFFSPIALALSFIKKVKIIGTPWGSDILYTNEKENWSLKQRVIYTYSIKKLVKRINYFTCDAEHLKARLIELGANKDRIDIIYFGTDSNLYTPENRSVDLRATWGLEKEDVAILSNRNLFKVYDIPTLVTAFKHVNDRYSNTFLLIGGSGPELTKLEKLVKSLGIQGRVRFLGKLDQGEFEKSVASADIYVSTSTSDGGLASSIAEAMASEIPVVITDFGENIDWLLENRNGLSFPVGDWEQLAEKIIFLLKNSDIREVMGKSARKTVSLKLDPKIEAEKLNRIYRTKI